MNRFLHIIPYANLGGTEKDCLYSIKELNKDSHFIWVLDKEGPMSREWFDFGAEIKHLDILKTNPFKFYKSLTLINDRRNPDGIFYWSTIRLPWIRAALGNYHCRLAVHVGNPANSKFKTICKNLILHKFLPGTIETNLFACSNHVRKSLLKDPYYSKFKSTISLNPVEIPHSNPYKNRQITKSTNLKIGLVARLDPIKDHETVIRAFGIIQNEYPESILELVGDGPLRNDLKILVNELGLTSGIKFLGSQSNVYSYLQSWDLFLYATTPEEGLGNALSEALANGLPSIASDLPMLQEIDGSSEAIGFVPPNDPEAMAKAAIQLLGDFQRRKRMSGQAYERARDAFSAARYTNDRMSYLLGDQ